MKLLKRVAQSQRSSRMTEDTTTADLVLHAAVDLDANGQLVTREAVSEVTGLKLAIVDDRLKHLTDHGLLNKRQRGVYQPVSMQGPPRTIYHSILPGSIHKIEIGDDHVITLSPAEARTLGHMMAGAAFAYQTNELAYQSMERTNELARQVAKMGRKVRNAQGAAEQDE